MLWTRLCWLAVLSAGCGDHESPPLADAPPDAPYTGPSTLTVDPIRMLADGRATGSVIVTLRDGDGRAIAGRTVELATAGAGSQLGVTSAISDSDGVANTTVVGLSAGSATITARSDEIVMSVEVTFDALATPCSGTQLLPFPPMLDVDFFTVVDLDGDTFPDLLGNLGGIAPPGLHFSRGHGDGTFDPPVPTSFVVDAPSMLLADINNDGAIDVIERTSPLQASLNNGDATFQAPLLTTIESTAGLAAGDFDADGKVDLAFVSSTTNDLQVATGNGDGTFAAPIQTGIIGSFVTLLAGDLDENGSSDLVMIFESGSTGSVLIADGTGGFAAPASLSFPQSQLLLPRLADVDADGHLDVLAIGSSTEPTLFIKRGKGDGTFEATISIQLPGSIGLFFGFGIAIGDLDHDGVLDIAFGQLNGGPIVATHSNGDGTFSPVASTGFGTGLSARIALADFNRDGRIDLAHDEGLGTTIELGSAQGFTPVTTRLDTSLINITIQSWTTTLVDLDRDGHLDVVATIPSSAGSGGVATFHGNGDGTFGAGVQVGEITVPERLATGDLDRDGDPDVLVTQPTSLSVYRNDNGTLVSSGEIATNDAAGQYQIIAADFTGDARVDVLLTRPGSLLLFRGDGAGGLGQPERQTFTSTIGFGGHIAAADLDADGVLDLVSAVDASTITILRGLGDGSFETTTTANIGGEVFGLAVADVDQDDQPDIVVGVRNSNNAAPREIWVFSPLNGELATPVISTGGFEGHTFTVVDLNRDGALDVVAGEVAYGHADRTFTFSSPYPLLETFGDIDHDGMLDSVSSGVVARQNGCF